MFNETKKIMHTDAKCSAMCVRISSLRAHSEAVWVETDEPIDVEAAKKAIAAADGVTLVDDIAKVGAKANADANAESMAGLPYPMPLYAAGKDDVYVGRVRKDLANENGLTFWLTGDQIKKGAALNAVQIAEYLIKVGNVK